MLSRWVISDDMLDLAETPGIAESHGKKIGAKWLYCVIGSSAALQELGGVNGAIVLPGLATPAELVPASVLALLAAAGIVPAPGEQLLNLLRRFRDQNSGENGVSLDISMPV